MRAHQVMTHNVVTVSPQTPITEAADLMLRKHISGLPVVDDAGKLVGVVSEGDFLRRAETGTQRRRSRWLGWFVTPGQNASEFVQEHGRKVSEVMSTRPLTVTEDTTLEAVVSLMEKHGIKRVPVMQGDKLVGIVTRSNLLHAIAGLARDIADPTADDDHIRKRIVRAIEGNDWCPIGLTVTVRDGVVDLHGVILDERYRQAAIVAAENTAGVKKVHDHLYWVETYGY